MDLPQLTPEQMAEDRSPVVLGVVSMFFVIATGILGLRVWTRIHIVKQTGYDDWAASFSLVSFLASRCASIPSHETNMYRYAYWVTRFGLGRHMQTLDLETYINFTKCFWCSVVFYGLSHLAFKMAFLLQYYRVLVTHFMRKYYIAAMVLVLSWGISVFVMSIFFCVPIQGFWDHSIPAKCLSQQVLYYVFGACSIITDVIIFILPLPAIFKLQLPRSQKLYLLGIFSLGFFIVAISVFRLQFLTIKPDFSYWNVTPALWSMGELTAAMVCLCLPPLKALAARMGLVTTTQNASSRGRSSRPPTSVTPLAKSVYASPPTSPGEKPSQFGNFAIQEADLDQSEQSTSSSLSPV
ncbi:hypothetical protein CPLU01_02396 [Colletotrichum plurivorum]|uniref:Rhodopsin domain-containing protein n=1 Tax=Colletotrichum plurivorum TaxID=2175906 RepID=A0A8H6NN05_9PEZI|nr:hypothetical protein CPLU01_02396 [Colletotrichum plurivorum]